MRRTAVVLILAILVAGLFISGLVWMTKLRERGWANNPEIRSEQMRFVMAVAIAIAGAWALNRVLNRKQYR